MCVPKFIYSVVIIVVSLTIPDASSTEIEACDNGLPIPAITQINDCKEPPCLFRRGFDIVANVTFKSPAYTEKLRPVVFFKILSFEFVYPLIRKDGCKSLTNTRCPLEKSEKVDYQLKIPILFFSPKIPISIRLVVFGDHLRPLFCVRTNGLIVE